MVFWAQAWLACSFELDIIQVMALVSIKRIKRTLLLFPITILVLVLVLYTHVVVSITVMLIASANNVIHMPLEISLCDWYWYWTENPGFEVLSQKQRVKLFSTEDTDSLYDELEYNVISKSRLLLESGIIAIKLC